jgi:hypothetical protein
MLYARPLRRLTRGYSWAMRVGTVSLSVLTAALALTAVSVAARPSGASSHAKSSEPPAGYLANSTQAVCALTGEHGSIYQEIPYNYTDTQFGLIAGDSGSSFEYDGKVWWLFGNTDPSPQAPWGTANVTSRWPTVVAPLNSTAAEGSDSMAWSSELSVPSLRRPTTAARHHLPRKSQGPTAQHRLPKSLCLSGSLFHVRAARDENEVRRVAASW